MLTIETLKKNEALNGLTDAQLAAIAALSQSDEQTVINTRIGQLHGQYEADVLNVTGIAKNSSEKAYDYNKRVLSSLKESADKAAALQSELNTTKEDLVKAQKALEDKSPDAALKQQLTDAKAQVTGLQDQLNKTKAAMAAQKVTLKAEYDNARIGMAIDAAMAGFKFKDGITGPIQKALMAQAKAEVLARGKAEIDNNGSVIFRAADNTILVNSKNALNPYTIDELLSETSIADALVSATSNGGGTIEPLTPQPLAGTPVGIAGARTQVEADEMIAKALMAQGLTTDSPEFQDKFIETRKAQNVSSLPIR